jgi:hypothetical protein
MWLQTLKEVMPRLCDCDGILGPRDSTGPTVEAAASSFGIVLAVHKVRGRTDVDAAFQSMDPKPLRSTIHIVLTVRRLEHKAVCRFNCPSSGTSDDARNEGLMAYGPNLPAFYHQQGVIAAKKLPGAKLSKCQSRRQPSLSL